MKVHVFLSLAAGRVLNITRTATFDLHTTAGFLLNMLDIRSAMTHNLCTKVESRNRLEIDRDFLFGPFALYASLANFQVLGA